MSEATLYALIGYAASILVAASLMMTSVVRLRVVNLVGAVTFTVYGLLIDAYPVAAVNLLIVGINIFHLRRMRRGAEYFEVLDAHGDSEYLRRFLDFHAEDIRRHVPTFERSERPDVAMFVLRDMVPAGLLMGRVDGGTLHVSLDYVIPEYRDFRVGRYLFDEHRSELERIGVERIEADGGAPRHARYLEEMGFERQAAGDRYVMRLRRTVDDGTTAGTGR